LYVDPGAGSIAKARFTDSGITPAIPAPPARREAAFKKSRLVAISKILQHKTLPNHEQELIKDY
jgi:hypothetical protein